ncbi:DNA methyltransferase [Helicobacter sp. T3_23-1059]
MQEINYALVEDKRPPIYTAMKYWGKKPHNIWRKYIDIYTPKNGVFLDAFCGSAMSAIESLKVKRKTIAFDINPLSSFLLEIYTSPFDFKAFKKEATTIIERVKKNEIYQKLWCYDGELHNFKYENNAIYEICKSNKSILKKVRDIDIEALDFANSVDLEKLGINFIDEPFLDSNSFSANFIKNIGGNNFKFIWTKRNLIVLSLIFKEILKVSDEVIKKQLLFGFIMITHLCCKMNIPRRDSANRNFSTSWGRSAYVCSSRQMEQNPLLLFERNCFNKQSVKSSLNASNDYIDKNIKIKKVSNASKLKDSTAFDLKYGVVNILKLDDYINEKSVDFIITDPPYGGLVQYLDLSYLWLLWLKKLDTSYASVDFASEITINKKCDIKVYDSRFTQALKQLHRVLKDNGKMVITFHNKDIAIWNSFMRSLRNANFIIEKVIHQKNRRSGESVVANPYGTSGTDFYLRCAKNIHTYSNDNLINGNLEQRIVDIAIKAIAERSEPTPYEILFDAILAEITSQGLIFSDDCDGDIKNALNSQINKIFTITKDNGSKAGNLWWLKEPRKYINYIEIPLSQRVDKLVLFMLRNNALIALDDILASVYKHFPNGLTPDESSILKSLNKYATKSSNAWIYNPNSDFSKEATTHTLYISYLAMIGKKLGFDIFIGKREQQEPIENKRLIDFATLKTLDFISDEFERKRVSMIDILFIKDKEIHCIFEIENSTSIISALHRASVLDKNIAKFIVIPDARINELLAKQEPLSKEAFIQNNWKYLLYSDIDKLIKTINPQIQTFAKDIV